MFKHWAGWAPGALVLVVALLVVTAATLALGPRIAFVGDAAQYSSLARNLADGKGYINARSPWPTRPAYDRMPGWPIVITVPLSVAPGLSEAAASRLAGVLVLAASAAIFVSLGRTLGLTPVFAMAAGLLIAFSPSLIYLVVSGMSEPCMILFYAGGLVLLLRVPAARHPYRMAVVSGLAFGASALTRSNMIGLPVLLTGMALVCRPVRQALLGRLPVRLLACWFVAAMILPAAWILRNYAVSGHPTISSIEGETLYGANNHFVAANPVYKGYWVMPDEITGEIPKMQLAAKLGNDLALNNYYRRQAVAWVSTNVDALPGLVAHKFYRSLLPQKFTPEALIAVAHRVLIAGLAMLTFRVWWPRMSRGYLAFCGAMLILHVITTAVFYGVLRWTHAYFDILLIIPAMYGVQEVIARWRTPMQPGAGDLTALTTDSRPTG